MSTTDRQSWRQSRTDRFRILQRDDFTCRYCGARPGSYFLEVDHLVPRARGGSDNEENLVCACKTCNSRKSDTIFFPRDLVEREYNTAEHGFFDEGVWFVYKTFGKWMVVFDEHDVGVLKEAYGFIEAERLYRDRHLLPHLYEKTWTSSDFADMEMAFDCVKRLVRDTRE